MDDDFTDESKSDYTIYIIIGIIVLFIIIILVYYNNSKKNKYINTIDLLNDEQLRDDPDYDYNSYDSDS